jgi:hypothetical protein
LNESGRQVWNEACVNHDAHRPQNVRFIVCSREDHHIVINGEDIDLYMFIISLNPPLFDLPSNVKKCDEEETLTTPCFRVFLGEVLLCTLGIFSQFCFSLIYFEVRDNRASVVIALDMVFKVNQSIKLTCAPFTVCQSSLLSVSNQKINRQGCSPLDNLLGSSSFQGSTSRFGTTTSSC